MFGLPLSLFLPLADLVLLDHDAAIITLFENLNLVTLAKRTHLPYAELRKLA